MRVVRTVVGRPGRRGLRASGRLRVAGCAALIAALAGCAPSLQHEHVDLQTLTREQMAPSHFRTAYEAVEALRSNWFNVRTNTVVGLSGGNVMVYMDNVRLGGIEELQTIPIGAVTYIRHFDAVEATTRWGLDHTQGVIYVSTHPLGSAAGPPGS